MAPTGTHAQDEGEAWGELPRRFGPYVLVAALAEGGFGAVYLARLGGSDEAGMEGVEKYCVVKTLQTRYTSDKDYVARFIDEARVVVRLTHRAICPVFDVGKVGEKHYLAMEYVAGVDLRTLADEAVLRGRPLPENVVVHIVEEVLDALDYAHRLADPASDVPLQVVHRDVSPQNILVNFEAEVKLIDFGLALSAHRMAEDTQPNIVLGKMAYMAPEHARGDSIDARADLFSVGAIAYELFTRERYYEGLSHDDIWQIAGTGYVPRKMGELDPQLAKILARATAAERDFRFTTCGQFRDELESYAYARGLRRGDRELRSILSERFSAEREVTRELISRHSTSPPTVLLGRPEPTTTFAASPAHGPELTSTNAERASRRGPATGSEVTTAAPRSTTLPTAQPRKRAAFVGAGVGLGIVFALALFVVRGGSTTTPLDEVSVVVPGDDVAAAVAPVAAPLLPVIVTPPAPPAATLPVAMTPVAAPPAAPRTTPKRTPERAPKKPAAALPDGATVKQKLDFLDKHCPAQACTGAARAANAALGSSTTIDELKRFKADLDACVRRCTR